MRKFIIAAAAVATLSSPAFAAEGGEGRVTLRGSYDTTDTDVEADEENASVGLGDGIGYGIAAGYDFNLDSVAFAGIEVGYDGSSVKKTFAVEDELSGTIEAGREITAIARIGFKPAEKVKLYGLLGYSNLKIKLSDGADSASSKEDALTYGAGMQYNFNDKIGANVEYRRSSFGINETEFDGFGFDDAEANYSKSRVMFGLSYKF